MALANIKQIFIVCAATKFWLAIFNPTFAIPKILRMVPLASSLWLKLCFCWYFFCCLCWAIMVFWSCYARNFWITQRFYHIRCPHRAGRNCGEWIGNDQLGIILFLATRSALFIFGSVIISGTLILAFVYFDDLYHVECGFICIHMVLWRLALDTQSPRPFWGLLPSRRSDTHAMIWVGFLNFIIYGRYWWHECGWNPCRVVLWCYWAILSPIADLRLAPCHLRQSYYWDLPLELAPGAPFPWRCWVRLGYIMGGLMFYLAQWPMGKSLILLLILFDSGVTLCAACCWCIIFQAHRQHFQQAVQGRASHGQIAALLHVQIAPLSPWLYWHCWCHWWRWLWRFVWTPPCWFACAGLPQPNNMGFDVFYTLTSIYRAVAC